MKRLLAAAALALAPLCAADITSAQNYPARSIQVIVPFAGGSASDVITRVLLERMGTSMGRRFIVDNRPGAGAILGTEMGAKAAPDGYTLTMAVSSAFGINPTLIPNCHTTRSKISRRFPTSGLRRRRSSRVLLHRSRRSKSSSAQRSKSPVRSTSRRSEADPRAI